MKRVVLLLAMFTILFPWIRPPAYCHLDDKGDYMAWSWAYGHMDRGLMYEVCERGPMG